jgi:hypothetical protein
LADENSLLIGQKQRVLIAQTLSNVVSGKVQSKARFSSSVTLKMSAMCSTVTV